jgi:hypothetical protein
VQYGSVVRIWICDENGGRMVRQRQKVSNFDLHKQSGRKALKYGNSLRPMT